jgi:hypothetical protein
MAAVVIAAVSPARITLDPGDEYVAVWIAPSAPPATPIKPPITVSQYAALF